MQPTPVLSLRSVLRSPSLSSQPPARPGWYERSFLPPRKSEVFCQRSEPAARQLPRFSPATRSGLPFIGAAANESSLFLLPAHPANRRAPCVIFGSSGALGYFRCCWHFQGLFARSRRRCFFFSGFGAVPDALGCRMSDLRITEAFLYMDYLQALELCWDSEGRQPRRRGRSSEGVVELTAELQVLLKSHNQNGLLSARQLRSFGCY
ncbi:hypothetical protein J1605_013639 [Eschrichtius robustus]|uniref:Uncharacterized protein n=1 Tax=Eschrichtius robustus TaxID=9764 RepID=A0AB34GGN8_ESCRO|nr:hypothetical protein J1605_013639 [Eschrichtius robustus]